MLNPAEKEGCQFTPPYLVVMTLCVCAFFISCAEDLYCNFFLLQ